MPTANTDIKIKLFLFIVTFICLNLIFDNNTIEMIMQKYWLFF